MQFNVTLFCENNYEFKLAFKCKHVQFIYEFSKSMKSTPKRLRLQIIYSFISIIERKI